MIIEYPEQTELYLTGDIGFEVSSRNFINEVKAVTSPNLYVHIDSLGGSTLDSISIYNALKDYTGTKTAIIDGVAMSAASYILMAFDKIVAKPNALLMLHNPLVEHCEGNAKEIAKVVSTLNDLTEIYVDAYASRTGKSPEDIQEILDAETYFTAQEALDIGLIDEIEITSAKPLCKDILTQAVQTRLVAYNKNKFMTTEETLKPQEESTVEQEVSTVVEEQQEAQQEPIYTVEEAQAVLDTAKEINTYEAYKLAYEQIGKAIEGIEDKSAFADILKQLEDLIKETEPTPVEEEVEEQPTEEPTAEGEVEQSEEAPVDDDKKRRNDIITFAEDINQDGTLDKLLIEALAGDMSLDEFKTASCKLLSVAKAKQSFKSLLYGQKTEGVEKPVLRRKSDYTEYYNNLRTAGRLEEAKQFKAKFNNIF